ncbi:hypothetical protein MRX96_025420 [Rhipicephalus microplus]
MNRKPTCFEFSSMASEGVLIRTDCVIDAFLLYEYSRDKSSKRLAPCEAFVISSEFRGLRGIDCLGCKYDTKPSSPFDNTVTTAMLFRFPWSGAHDMPKLLCFDDGRRRPVAPVVAAATSLERHRVVVGRWQAVGRSACGTKKAEILPMAAVECPTTTLTYDYGGRLWQRRGLVPSSSGVKLPASLQADGRSHGGMAPATSA